MRRRLLTKGAAAERHAAVLGKNFDDLCMICLNPLAGVLDAVTLPCGGVEFFGADAKHKLHRVCAEGLAAQKRPCPLCKAAVPWSEVLTPLKGREQSVPAAMWSRR